MTNKKLPLIIGAIAAVFVLYFVVTYNGLVKKEEKVKAQWNEVQNAYQRRLDLVPNLVNTVKGAAAFEANTIQAIVNARAKATAINVTGIDSAGFQQQSAAQNELATATNRLLITIEKYPELQGAQAFSALQTQLERTELRIKVARKDFNEAVQNYNSSARNFPSKIVASITGFKTLNGFTADVGTDKATEIKF